MPGPPVFAARGLYEDSKLVDAACLGWGHDALASSTCASGGQ